MSSIFGQRLKPNKKSEIVEEIGKGVTEWNENYSFYKNTVKNLGVYYIILTTKYLKIKKKIKNHKQKIETTLKM